MFLFTLIVQSYVVVNYMYVLYVCVYCCGGMCLCVYVDSLFDLRVQMELANDVWWVFELTYMYILCVCYVCIIVSMVTVASVC